MATLFWKKFKALCDVKGTSPNAVLMGMGASSASITYWANGGSPRSSTIKKISEYMGVPVDYFYNDLYPTGETVEVRAFPFGKKGEVMLFKQIKENDAEEPEESRIENEWKMDDSINALLSDPARRALLKSTAKLSKEDIEFVSRIVENIGERKSDD